MLVVAGHCGNGGVNILFDWFTPYAFHLGIFAFGSGYFYKTAEAFHQRSYLWRKIKHLVIPLYLCNLFYALLVQALHRLGIPMGAEISLQTLFFLPLWHGHQFIYNLGTWFIFPLFCILVINNVVHRATVFLGKYRAIFVFVLYLLLGLLSVRMARHGLNQEWFLLIDKILFLMPMFALGLLYRQYRFCDRVPSWLYFLVLFVAQYGLLLYFHHPQGNNISWMQGFEKVPVLMPFLSEFIGILFCLRLCAIATPVLKNNRLVMAIGSNTFAIMTHHLLGMMLVKAGFALLAMHFALNFDYQKFSLDIWYYYCPKGLWQTHFFYALAGVILPLAYIALKGRVLKKCKEAIAVRRVKSAASQS